MSERIEKSRTNWALIILIAVLGGAFAFGGYLLLTGRSKTPERPAQPVPAARPQAGRPDEPVVLTVFVPAEGGLAAESLSVKRRMDSQLQARETVAAMLASPRAAQVPVMKDFRLQAFFLDPAGTAYVDLRTAAERGAAGSAWDELLFLYGIANTLTQNFEEVKAVRFLVDGREAQALAGHIDVTAVFAERMDLVKQ